MSKEHEQDHWGSEHRQFDLECRPDDWEAPTEMTVYPSTAEEVTTEWLTVDYDHAVPVDTVR
jgi:hypothetical protein